MDEAWDDNRAYPTENVNYYYNGGPGLSSDAAKYLGTKRIVLMVLDNAYIEAVNLGQFSGKSKPPEGTPLEMRAPMRHHKLTHADIYQIQNVRLGKIADDKVWTSLTGILPIKIEGASSAPVSPIATGVPGGYLISDQEFDLSRKSLHKLAGQLRAQSCEEMFGSIFLLHSFTFPAPKYEALSYIWTSEVIPR